MSLKILATFALCSFALTAIASTALTTPQGILIVDTGSDLSHPKLKNLALPVDGYLGWNTVSNSSDFFPAWLTQPFQGDQTHVDLVLSMYTRMVCGDYQGKVYFIEHPDDNTLAFYMSHYAHGTNVAGIAAEYSQGLAKIQSVNVFYGTQPPSSTLSPFQIHLKSLLKLKATVGSIFDSEQTIQQMIRDVESSNAEQAQILSQYLSKIGFGIVNLSLHVSYEDVFETYDSIWRDELKKAGITNHQDRDPTQEKNFQNIVNSSMASYEAYWRKVIVEHPDVLFVAAAGNFKWNNDEHKIIPAGLSIVYPNVITVAASDKYDDRAKFSNFGPKTVNIGAPGVCITSLAPMSHEIALTGTSQSAPAVSGLAAQIRALRPDLSPAQIRSVIENTAKKVGGFQGDVTSGGVLDPVAAIQAIKKTLQ